MPHPVPGLTDRWSLHSTSHDGITVVAVAGEVDTTAAPALAAELTAQAEQQPRALLVDLGQVVSLSPCGVSALLDAHDQTANRGVPLHLVAAGPEVLHALEVSGLADLVPRHRTLLDAFRSAGPAVVRRMRVSLVSEQASPLVADHGQGAHVGQLSAALSGLGHEVVVYTRRNGPSPLDRVRTAEGYDVVHVPAGPQHPLTEDETVPHLGEFAEFLAREWRARPPDVVHTHHWTSALVGVIGAHLVGVPVVHTYTAVGAERTGRRADAEVLVARRASAIVAMSAQEAQELWRLGLRRTQVSVLPCGVDPVLFRPEGPVAVRNALRRVLVTGGPAHRGGVADTLTAVSTMDDTELVVAGNCGDDADLRELAGRLGVRDRVVFAGAVPRAELPRLLRSADAVVCVPSAEPFGVAALQAMACGVPVVATAVGALLDVVVHNVTGLHVPAGKPATLARALRRLLADDTWREEFGVAGRDRVLARYCGDRIAREAVAVYERVAACRGVTTKSD
ncbi:anti-sigma factor antagonist [Lentzea chajnantorensis]